MNVLKLIAHAISAGVLTFSLSTTAIAGSIVIDTFNDGTILNSTFAVNVNTTLDNSIVKKNGPISQKGIFKFNLSGIAAGSTINSIFLDVEVAAPVVGGTPPFAVVDIFAFSGAGGISPADFGAAATQVFDGKTGDGDLPLVRSFELAPFTVFENVLNSTNFLTLRIETNEASDIRIATQENLLLNPAQLRIDFTTISAVPLPAALPLFGTGLAIMGFIGWRRKQRKVA